MIRGLYAAASGMLASFRRQETLSNNLANINTPGFKRDLTPVRSGPDLGEVRPINGMFAVPYDTHPIRAEIGTVGTGSLNDPVATDLTGGDVRETGRELDLALVGPGFFEMRSPEGHTFYTRAGELNRDGAGRLVDARGAFLMGDEGPIRVGQGIVQVQPDGTVLSDGAEAGIIRTMVFPSGTAMRKTGDNAFVPVDPAARPTFVDQDTIVQQGAIEGSNVDPAQATIEMMSAMRSYEAAQRLVQMNDTVLERAVNDLGRV